MRHPFAVSLSVLALAVTLAGCGAQSAATTSVGASQAATTSATPKVVTYVSKLGGFHINVPADWHVQEGADGSLALADASGAPMGGVEILAPQPGDGGTYLPNHSREVGHKDIPTPLGTGQLYTLERSDPAAGGSASTWGEQHAFVTTTGKVFDVWLRVGDVAHTEPVKALTDMLTSFGLGDK